MTDKARKTPRRAANDLTVLLRTVLGEDRFPVDVEALAIEVSRNQEDPITAVKGVDIDGFEGMLAHGVRGFRQINKAKKSPPAVRLAGGD